MSDQPEREPDLWVGEELTSPMPDELHDVIEGYSTETRRRMLDGWEAVGEDGREHHRGYIRKAWTRQGRRLRAVRVASQLIDPGTGSTIDLRG